jgi:hypothetical protein
LDAIKNRCPFIQIGTTKNDRRKTILTLHPALQGLIDEWYWNPTVPKKVSEQESMNPVGDVPSAIPPMTVDIASALAETLFSRFMLTYQNHERNFEERDQFARIDVTSRNQVKNIERHRIPAHFSVTG